jgi:hypothetical protein
MTTQPIRGRTRAALALCGIAALAAAACAAPALNAAARSQQPATAATTTTTAVAAAGLPVVVDCSMHAQTRPGRFVLACADGGAYLAGLHWASWGSSAAFADGVSIFNDCVPTCAAGHGHSFPVLVALWGAEPRPGHTGERYFTRMTIIYTGSRAYHAGGKLYHLPPTVTEPLSPAGGA